MQSDTENHNTFATYYRPGQIRLPAAFRRVCHQRLTDCESISQVEHARLRAAVTEAEQTNLLSEGARLNTVWTRTTRRMAGAVLVLLCASAQADVVIYTDAGHPASVADESTRVVMLDAPQQLQDRLFGTLPDDPQAAAEAAHDVLSSPDWQESERRLAESYRGVVAAWQLGLLRYPAVVFDSQYVVYGTASESEARIQFDQWQEAAR